MKTKTSATQVEQINTRCEADVRRLHDLRIGASFPEGSIIDKLLQANHSIADTMHQIQRLLTVPAHSPMHASPRAKRSSSKPRALRPAPNV